VCRLIEVFEDKEKIGIVLDYCKGMSLYSYLQRIGKLDVGEAFQIVHILLQVVDEMNQKGFVHRDIKPANIIIDYVDDEKSREPRAKKK
jgi:serine/threonine-protein kinase ULK/ATG1